MRLLRFVLLYCLVAPAFAGTPVDCVHELLGTDVSIKQAQEVAKDWLARRGKNVKETLTNPWNNPKTERRHAELWEVDGVPATLKEIDTTGRIFRHYGPKDTINAIKQSRVLISGYVNYVEAAPGVYKKNWNAINGAFLTSPDASAHSVGVVDAKSAHYVDVRVAPGVPVLELERGLIYIIPLRKNYRVWVRELYARYLSGATMPESDLKMCQKIEREGGIEPFVAAVPVEIVGEGP